MNKEFCFDLQFRKDTRKERTNSPTYYRWKAQFIVTVPKSEVKNLQKLKKVFDCGKITISESQARFAIQKISDISDVVIPYFHKNPLHDEKKKDFQLWRKAVEIILQNKGKHLTQWKKTDLCTLFEIHKISSKYKKRPRLSKWLSMAKSLI
jgi:hypothetical protein